MLSGEAYLRTFSVLKMGSFQCFVDDLATIYPEQSHVLLLDNSATQGAQALVIPNSIRLHFLPPYSPDLNPIERQHLKAPLEGSLLASLFALQGEGRWERGRLARPLGQRGNTALGRFSKNEAAQARWLTRCQFQAAPGR